MSDIEFGKGTMDEAGRPVSTHIYEALGVTVKFVSPILGRHENAYLQIMDAVNDDGSPKGTLSERRFAGALALIESVSFEMNSYGVQNGNYSDLPIELTRWIGIKAHNYYTATTIVPFVSFVPPQLPPDGET